jgi:hypothetical protein
MVKHYCKSEKILIPVEVTRGEFEAVQEFRRNAQPGEESNSPRVTNASLKVEAMINTPNLWQVYPDAGRLTSR